MKLSTDPDSGAPQLWSTSTLCPMAWTYILECSDGSYYVGSTRDLDQRLFDHERGLGAAYTKTRLPVTLVASFESDNVEEAYLFEKQVQGWSRAKKKAIIEGRFDGLPAQSRKGYRPSVQDPGSANPNGRGQAPWEMRRGRPHWLED